MIITKNAKLIVPALITLLIGGGLGFFGGMKYQQSKTPSRTFQLGGNNPQGRNGMRFGNGNGQAVRGQIISSDDKSITIKMQDGSTKIVILGSSTMIGKSTTGSITDLTKDENVIVFGTSNSDGSVTAQNIQIGNVTFGLRGSGSPNPTATPQGN